MSLTQLIQRPAVARAFKMLASTVAIAASTPRQRALVPSREPRNRSLVGTAFDYLVRIELFRIALQLGLKANTRPWIAEIGVSRVGLISITDSAFWRQTISEMRARCKKYEHGQVTLTDLVEGAQYLAHADLLLRCPRFFDPTFRARPEVSAELLALMQVFSDNRQLFSPSRRLALNPTFGSAEWVGGADADLLIDERLIDLKVVSRGSPQEKHLRQLAGYAALHRLGGIEGVCPTFKLHSLELYLARHGKLCRWYLDEMFKGAAFDRFCTALREEAVVARRESFAGSLDFDQSTQSRFSVRDAIT